MNLWRWKCGLPEEEVPHPMPSPDALRKSEWSSEFEHLMRNRLVMGSFRYGKMHDQSKGQYDTLSSIEKRVNLYRKTANKEHLVDIANIALVEFINPSVEGAHFSAIDDGEHAKRKC